ncbi:hypothetical protein CBS101457_005805 [Exobasidium rhododendri]|nr:hypothetical protein CBS101457_005805 [Exobasidium rhododendri]
MTSSSATLKTHLPYKEAKELFVSQLQGGSIYKINAVSLTALTTYALWACIRNRSILFSEGPTYRITARSGGAVQIWWLEFAILVVPLVLAITVLSKHLVFLNGILVLGSACILHFSPAPRIDKEKKKTHKRHWSKPDSNEEDQAGSDFGADDPFGGTAIPSDLLSSHDPLRISVDSAADSALAFAAPPTQYVPPGFEQGGHSSHSSRVSSEDSGHGTIERKLPLLNIRNSSTSSSPLRYNSADGIITSDVLQQPKLQSSLPAIPFQIQQGKNLASMKYVPRNQPFLSVYRAHMMLMTIICILAVDFQAFPREFAKCETWGTSLMDMGVGSFVFSMGIVSALPLLRSPRERFKPLRAQLLRDAKRSVPLLLLGTIRVILVKGVEYPEHISEYGVHWNFFITLALLPFFGTLCRPLTRLARFSVLGLALSSFHQLALSFTDLGPWAISNTAPRDTLLAQNKEGLVSFPGYLALFFLGLDLGHYVLPKDPYLAYRKPSKSRKKEKTDKLSMLLASFSILWWAAYYLTTLILGGQVSRRAANLPYVLWVTAYNSTFLLFYVLIYMLLLQPLKVSDKSSVQDVDSNRKDDLQESKTPLLLSSLNHAAFLVFLIANLLTGLINVSIQTMYSSDIFALFILVLYTSLCLALATFAHMYKWKLPI